MSTAIGTYATLADLKLRLGDADALDDTLLQKFCDQANMWVETKTGRVIAPYTSWSSTVASGFTAGSLTGAVVSGSGLAVGEAICFEALGAATRESATVLTVSTNTLTLATPLLYSHTGAVKRVYIFDGFDALENGKMLEIPLGVINVTSLEVSTFSAGQGGANVTNVVWYTIPTTDFFLRPTPNQRTPGWPATELWITNVPVPSDPTPSFYPGYNNIRIDANLGWPTLPDDLSEVALNIAVALYRGRGSTGGEIVSVGTEGQSVINRALTFEDRLTISRYVRKQVVIV